eukprot:12923089-Prorocentrum_lima.AAC.1
MAGNTDNLEVRLSTISGEPLATLHPEPGCIASKVKKHGGRGVAEAPATFCARWRNCGERCS